MLISDWCSDVCSSELIGRALGRLVAGLTPELLIELVARAALHPAQVAGREILLQLVEHQVVASGLGVQEVRAWDVRSREADGIGAEVGLLALRRLDVGALGQPEHALERTSGVIGKSG